MPQDTQNKFFLYLIAVAGFIAGFIYYTQSGAMELDIPMFDAGENDLAKMKELTIDFSVFSGGRITDLKVFGEAPVVPGQLGKTNIFSQ